VHEQVANKLSVRFADIGEQEVKNIPTPVHAYMVAMRREDGTYSMPKLKKKPASAAATPNWMWPLAVMVVCLVAVGVGGFLYLASLETPGGPKGPSSASNDAAPTPSPSAAPAPSPAPKTAAPAAPPPPSPPPSPSSEKFAAETVPFVSDRIRGTLANEYVSAADTKALALNITGSYAFAIGQQNEETAKGAAIEQCQKKADAIQSPRKCELYAVGNTICLSAWQAAAAAAAVDQARSVDRKAFRGQGNAACARRRKGEAGKLLCAGRKNQVDRGRSGRAILLQSRRGAVEDSARRNLESCGAVAGVPCMIVAVDDAFVVPVPSTLKVTGFFQAAIGSSIAADARDDVSRKLANASSGWSAVAVGASGRPGLALKAANEQNAVNEALGNCVKRDSDCHVIAIRPVFGRTNLARVRGFALETANFEIF